MISHESKAFHQFVRQVQEKNFSLFYSSFSLFINKKWKQCRFFSSGQIIHRERENASTIRIAVV